MATAEARQQYWRRGQIVEFCHAWIKCKLGPRRFHVRGRVNVQRIVQAFADEIFRVFARSHPNIDLQFENANDDVTRMFKRAQAA
jgi:hypothetical protein